MTAKLKPRGLRCTACHHLIATTRPWLVVARPLGKARMFCHECADDIEAYIRTLTRELATPVPSRKLAKAWAGYVEIGA